MNEPTGNATERATVQAAALIAIGVVIEALSLQVVHPMSFLAFAFLGGGLVVLGLARYAWPILRAARSQD